MQSAEGDEALANLVPLLRDRGTLEGKPTAYLCENYTCQRPVNDAAELAAQLD